MAFTLEDGSGVVGANAGVSVAFVTQYLADRNRAGEGGWGTTTTADDEAAIVQGTDFVELKFAKGFKGTKLHTDLNQARATLTFTGQPADTETVTIGGVVYTFNATLGGANSVLIGADVDTSIANLVNAINGNALELGVSHGTGTVAHPTVTAECFIGDTLTAIAKAAGTTGNSIASTTTVTGATWNFATLNGGSDIVVPQALSFPRAGLYDCDGLLVQGVPLEYQKAIAELAVRARAGTGLWADPATPGLGPLTYLREKVGPIEEERRYIGGTSADSTVPSYPAAEQYLADFLEPGFLFGSGAGSVIRA